MKEYDPDDVDARAIEAAIEGVHVIRHGKCRLTVTRPNSINSSYDHTFVSIYWIIHVYSGIVWKWVRSW